jgi:hypothetical protein
MGLAALVALRGLRGGTQQETEPSPPQAAEASATPGPGRRRPAKR